MMKTSDAGLQFVASHEGWVNHVYKDVASIPTIGYGHVVRPGEVFPATITQGVGLALLRQDLKIAEDAVNSGVHVDISQNQFDAMVSFAFNVGGGGFKTSTLLRLLNAGDVQGSADQFLKWCHARENGVDTIDQGLLARRKDERKVFLTPDVVVVQPEDVFVEAPVPPLVPSLVEQPTPEPVPTPDTQPTSPPPAVVDDAPVPAWKSVFNFFSSLTRKQ